MQVFSTLITVHSQNAATRAHLTTCFGLAIVLARQAGDASPGNIRNLVPLEADQLHGSNLVQTWSKRRTGYRSGYTALKCLRPLARRREGRAARGSVSALLVSVSPPPSWSSSIYSVYRKLDPGRRSSVVSNAASSTTPKILRHALGGGRNWWESLVEKRLAPGKAWHLDLAGAYRSTAANSSFFRPPSSTHRLPSVPHTNSPEESIFRPTFLLAMKVDNSANILAAEVR